MSTEYKSHGLYSQQVGVHRPPLFIPYYHAYRWHVACTRLIVSLLYNLNFKRIMKKIVIFNHKGGVSKTTTTFHIGWMLADMGHKVLLVDGDPQCNLTSLFLGSDQFDRYYEEPETAAKNIKDGVSMAFEGQPRPIEAFDCPVSERNKNLYLLPGHMNLSEYEGALNFALTATSALPSLQSLPGTFNQLIEKVAEKYGIEYVIIDLNPALSSINQVLFLSSDAFLIPINPDAFAKMALKSLSKILPRWVRWAQDNRSTFEKAVYALPDSIPLFVGILPQKFNIRNGVATKPYRVQIEELEQIVAGTVFPSFKEAGMTFPSDAYREAEIDEFKALTEIKDFQGLSPKSHKHNVPVFALSDEELENSGVARDTDKKNMETFRRLYQEACDKIIKLLNYAREME